jgi:hypothetical protein
LYPNFFVTLQMRRKRGEVEDKFGDRLEKLMTGWSARFKVGSATNKPLMLGDEDPKIARLARIAQIFFELYSTVVSAKGKS